jgi:hypothetical protein
MALSSDTSRTATAARLTGGGPAGNERLTATTGIVLLVLLAALGVTILRIGALLNVHMFLGVALIAPVGLKLASTGYRFARYYTSEPRYRHKGPPSLPLRAIAPIVVLSTVAVLASGVVLLLAGPGSHDPWVLIHKITFFVWVGFMSVHVLGHVRDLPRVFSTRQRLLAGHDAVPRGGSGRAIAMASTLLLGAALAVAAIADFAPWTQLHSH